MTSLLAKRLVITTIVLAIFQGGAFFFLQRAKSSEVRPLRGDLNEVIPYNIGEDDEGGAKWHGEDRKSDDEIEKTVGARHAISRLYTDKVGRGISVHIGEWDSLQTPTLPHPPAICYQANGAEIIRRESFAIGDSDSADAELLVIENRGIRSLVLYWYAWEDEVCTTRGEACMARLRMIGSREWPPVVKVMLETPSAPTEAEAKEALNDLAAEIRQRTRDL